MLFQLQAFAATFGDIVQSELFPDGLSVSSADAAQFVRDMINRVDAQLRDPTLRTAVYARARRAVTTNMFTLDHTGAHSSWVHDREDFPKIMNNISVVLESVPKALDSVADSWMVRVEQELRSKATDAAPNSIRSATTLYALTHSMSKDAVDAILSGTIMPHPNAQVRDAPAQHLALLLGLAVTCIVVLLLLAAFAIRWKSGRAMVASSVLACTSFILLPAIGLRNVGTQVRTRAVMPGSDLETLGSLRPVSDVRGLDSGSSSWDKCFDACSKDTKCSRIGVDMRQVDAAQAPKCGLMTGAVNDGLMAMEAADGTSADVIELIPGKNHGALAFGAVGVVASIFGLAFVVFLRRVEPSKR